MKKGLKNTPPLRHEVILYLVDREINELMIHLDLCPQGKVYACPMEMSFTTTTPVNEKYFLKMINESKKEGKMWIAAISYMDNFFVDKGIIIISNGKYELFLN